MPIKEHPAKGSIILCDFDKGFCLPEMVKRRPVVVISPKIKARPGLCTIVALSMTAPVPVMPYHAKIDLPVALPSHYQSDGLWIKGDMVNTVGFHRLDLIRTGKARDGSRLYYYETLNDRQIALVYQCVLRGLGLSALTKHME